MDAKNESENKDKKQDGDDCDKAKVLYLLILKSIIVEDPKLLSKVGNKTKTKNIIVCDRANRYYYRGVYDENKNVVNKFEKQMILNQKKLG